MATWWWWCLSFWKCKGGAHTPETVVIEFGVTSEVAENFTLCVCVCVCVCVFPLSPLRGGGELGREEHV